MMISGRFISVIVPDPAAALKFQFWVEDGLHLRGLTVAIFVDEPGFPLEFWSKVLL
jgi:hypothetical protein